MTQKTQKLINTYSEKLDLEINLFELGFSTYEKAYLNLKELEKDFEKLICTMYHYNLISEKDFRESSGLSWKLYYIRFEKLVELNYKTEV